MSPITLPRGTRDLLPDEAPAWRWVHELHAAAAARHGYRYIDTPIFEQTELFSRGVGGGTDIVEKEMYTFTDRGGRSMTLRPEGTAPVLRAVLGAHLEQVLRPVRVHYAMPMFRYDRPQAGRYRQFAQLGVECIGERDPSYDAEVIEVAWRFMADLHIDGVEVQVNSLGDRDDRLRYREALVAYYTPLRDSLCEDCRRRLDINPLRLLDCKRDAQYVAAAPLLGDHLGEASRDYFAGVVTQLEGAAIPHVHNQRLVRGLDYYAHTAFEFWHTSLAGAQNALGGGGRYDGLVEKIKGPSSDGSSTPGMGWAAGVERILLVGEPAPVATSPVDLFVALGDRKAGFGVMGAARSAGLTAQMELAGRSLKGQLGYANVLGARYVAIVEQEETVLKDMQGGRQETISTDTVVHAVLRALRTL